MKLRALPTDGHHPTDHKTAASERTATATWEQTGPDEQDKEEDLNDRNNSSNGDGPAVPSLRPPPSGKPEEREPISGGTDEPAKARPRNSSSSSNSVVSMSSSKSSKSTTCTKIPVLGYDLCTLTLGRIADGFRRDTYSFPVDLKGRGEGRAVEARAVLQVGWTRPDIFFPRLACLDHLRRGPAFNIPVYTRPTYYTSPLQRK